MVRRRLLAAVCGGGLALAQLASLLQPDDRAPAAVAEGFGSLHDFPLPSPDQPVEDIFAQLRHPAAVMHFLRKHAKNTQPETVSEFFGTYRLSPEEFLRKGGACNSYSEWWCRWLRTMGVQPFIVRLMPKPDAEDWDWRRCHEATIMRTGPGEYIIFDNSRYQVIDHCGSAEQALEQAFPSMQVSPFGGIVQWNPVQNHWFPQMLTTAQPNHAELPEHPHFALSGRAGTATASAE